MATDTAQPTRTRILDAALAMFAERGYEGTSIAELERAAGLSPGSGALYRHFPSKRRLLDEALRERMGAIQDMRSRLDVAPLGDLRSELTLLARWGLAELERERLFIAIVMREGNRLPDVVAGFREAVVDPAHAIARESLRRYAEARGASFEDPEAVAVALTSSMVGFALQGQMLGRDFVAVDDESFVAAWVGMAQALIEDAETQEREKS
jgi:AcrR family transcriptional regulator